MSDKMKTVEIEIESTTSRNFEWLVDKLINMLIEIKLFDI